MLARIGKAHGKTAAQVCLRWLVQQDVGAIPRTSKVERLEENIAIFDFELTAAEMREIAALARPRRPPRRLRLFRIAEVGLSPDTAIVLFSGGQDSTVCLAWALRALRARRDHRLRLRAAAPCGTRGAPAHARAHRDAARRNGRRAWARITWSSSMRSPRCRTPRSPATSRSRSPTNGLPTTFVPGRNLIFFTFAGALAYRRGARHLIGGMCETDFSGYPDCRDDTLKAHAGCAQPRHGSARSSSIRR